MFYISRGIGIKKVSNSSNDLQGHLRSLVLSKLTGHV